MTHIPVMVRVVDEVIPSATVERYGSSDEQVISVCFACGSIVFYQIVTYKYEGSEHATDTCTYCAVCGQMQGGYVSDPFDEIEYLKPKEAEKMSVFDKVQPYVSSDDGELFDLSFNTDDVSYEILELTHNEITELISSIEDQVVLLKEAYQTLEETANVS